MDTKERFENLKFNYLVAYELNNNRLCKCELFFIEPFL